MAGAREPVAVWLTRVAGLHDRIIARYGGAPGILDESMLRAAIERPWTGLADGTLYYPTVLDKAAELLERLINYHPFVDGNKRTATILTFEFLREQGYVPEAENDDIVDVAVRIAEKSLVRGDILTWLDRITPVRLRRFADPVPCPWCGANDVEQKSLRYSQPRAGAAGPSVPHRRAYWQCRRCTVMFTSGDHVLLLGSVLFLLHTWGFGDPLIGKVVTGPWWMERGGAPVNSGSVTVTKQDVSPSAYDQPTKYIAEVVAALRAKCAASDREG
ncbi:type II toxin-antitoxin system death-on-curing family toxin [candidate division WOR-3 bacterium]|nr:type II toxin-antitoxin system death-on-curing family toxin [candidate division WOR-3 bacterium]